MAIALEASCPICNNSPNQHPIGTQSAPNPPDEPTKGRTMIRAPLRLTPILLPHHEAPIFIMPTGPTPFTWVFTRISYQPSPWLAFDTTYQIAPDDTREFLAEIPVMDKAHTARFLKELYRHFGRDARTIDRHI
ncbi:hypothetical protein N9J26_01245, partial [bacterium]|nr:hypothetical protein [bacterium]